MYSRKKQTRKIKDNRKKNVSLFAGRQRLWETKPTPGQRFFDIAFTVSLVLIGLFLVFTLGPFLLKHVPF
jgi:hypothetical protein